MVDSSFLFHILMRLLPIFPHLGCWLWACPYFVELCSFQSYSLRNFVMKTCWKCPRPFASSKMILWFLSLIPFLWYITFIDTYIEPSLHIWNKANWMWWLFFFAVLLFGLQLFSWEFMHLYPLWILTCNFLFCCHIFTWCFYFF